MLAGSKNLLSLDMGSVNCGSDFHGKTKPAIHLGENGCVSPDEIKELLIKYQLIRG